MHTARAACRQLLPKQVCGTGAQVPMSQRDTYVRGHTKGAYVVLTQLTGARGGGPQRSVVGVTVTACQAHRCWRLVGLKWRCPKMVRRVVTGSEKPVV